MLPEGYSKRVFCVSELVVFDPKNNVKTTYTRSLTSHPYYSMGLYLGTCYRRGSSYGGKGRGGWSSYYGTVIRALYF